MNQIIETIIIIAGFIALMLGFPNAGIMLVLVAIYERMFVEQKKVNKKK